MRALFVCLQNAGRSQMAQAFAQRVGVDARSAGSTPAKRVHPEVAGVMQEVGIDLAGRSPRALTQEDVEWAEVVVTMGCGDACPNIPGRRYVDWELPDPKGRPIDEVRAVRNAIESRVRALSEGVR